MLQCSHIGFGVGESGILCPKTNPIKLAFGLKRRKLPLHTEGIKASLPRLNSQSIMDPAQAGTKIEQGKRGIK